LPLTAEKILPFYQLEYKLLPFFWRTKDQKLQLSAPQTRFAGVFWKPQINSKRFRRKTRIFG
jgi:hypothetical protein